MTHHHREGAESPADEAPGADRPPDADQAPDPDALSLARASAEAMYAADRASQHLGIRISDVAPGHASARMRVTQTMINGHDICHGGYVFALADTAFAFACNTYGTVTVAAAADVAFVAPARLGDELVAEAAERIRSGRSGIYDVTVRRSGDRRVIAEFRGHSRATAADLLADAQAPKSGDRVVD